MKGMYPVPLPYCSSWEGKEREIKFNEHFYYVSGALHMLFHFNPKITLGGISSHILQTNRTRDGDVK